MPLTLNSVTAQSTQAGEEVFQTRCASCHGSDGAGGEFGPDIVQAKPDGVPRRDLADVLANGISGAMPAIRLNVAETAQLTGLIERWRAPAMRYPVDGDQQAGAEIFFRQNSCAGCHRVGSRGGDRAPDLSSLARYTTISRIELALRKPEAVRSQATRVVLRLKSGGSITGVPRNESNYDIQLEGSDGQLHLVHKTEIAGQSATDVPQMPPFSGTVDERRNLLAFLTRLDGQRSREVEGIRAGSGDPWASADAISILRPALGDWPTYNGNVNGNRHSALDQLNVGNVSRLGAKWILPIPNTRRLEVTPTVVGGVMYVTAANQAYALDASNGRAIWHFARPLTKGVIGDAGTAINRGVAILGDRLFMVTDHAHVIALNRLNGSVLWDVEMADFRQHYGATSAPLVVGDLVISGTSGGDEGARGFIDAYRASTGERVWRFWNMPAPNEPLAETWIGRAIEHGCVSGWLTGSYDPSSETLFWATGNPCPDFNGDERKGDNLYSNSVLALDVRTGRLKWFYQFTPHDLHDWDAQEPLLLVDAEYKGRQRKLLLQANRNGFFYVLDRATGELLSAEPFVKNLTWASAIAADGRPRLSPNQEPTEAGVRVCPSITGATNWTSTAYSPDTRLFYVMALEACSIYTKSSAWWKPGESFYGGGTKRVPGEKPKKVLRAIEVSGGKVAWEIPQIGPGNSAGGVLSTAGGVVFYGDDSGALAAVDAKTGKDLWHFNTGENLRASPMTYLANGKQYVAMATGSNIVAFSLP